MSHIVERNVELELLFADDFLRLLLCIKKLLALGDILVRRHPAAPFKGIVHDAHHAPTAAVDNKISGFAGGNVGCHHGAVFIHIAEKRAALLAVFQKLTKRQARLHDRRRNVVQFYISRIAKDDRRDASNITSPCDM